MKNLETKIEETEFFINMGKYTGCYPKYDCCETGDCGPVIRSFGDCSPNDLSFIVMGDCEEWSIS